jgi:hypothetical protein
MNKIFVSAMAVGAIAAGATVSVEARAESAPAPLTLGAAELDAVKGGQALIDIRRSFNNRISRSGNSTATIGTGDGSGNTAESTSNFFVEQGTGVFIGLGGL